jgi:riboflavin kinase/FMN adenylyltransferase
MPCNSVLFQNEGGKKKEYNFASMQVHQHLEALPRFKKSVITIGTFDGVHRGHQKLIHTLNEEAARIGGESVLITFHPHPRKIVNAATSLQLINTLDEKIQLLSRHGIHHLVIVPFTEKFARQTAEAYIEDFLVQTFHPHTIIIGYDHHFGLDRKGNFALLQQQASRFNYHLIEIPKHLLNEIAISSTKIRTALLQSDVDTANQLLGYPFFFHGLVVHGDAIGRTIGYPTANLQYTNNDKIHLGHGVYAAIAKIKAELVKGMLSIGNRPTLTQSEEKVEINLFDFSETIYGDVLTVSVHKFLRPQAKYESMDLLKRQLARDKEESLKWLQTIPALF